MILPHIVKLKTPLEVIEDVPAQQCQSPFPDVWYLSGTYLSLQREAELNLEEVL